MTIPVSEQYRKLLLNSDYRAAEKAYFNGSETFEGKVFEVDGKKLSISTGNNDIYEDTEDLKKRVKEFKEKVRKLKNISEK